MKNIIIINILLWWSYGCLTAQELDLSATPFSRKGSYMSIMTLGNNKDERGLYIKDISGDRLWNKSALFKINLIREGQKDSIFNNIVATPASFTVRSGLGNLDAVFATPNTILFRSNVSVNISQAFDQGLVVLPISDTQWRIVTGKSGYVFTILKGQGTIDGWRKVARWELKENPPFDFFIVPNSDGELEFSINQQAVEEILNQKLLLFDEYVTEVQREFSIWSKPLHDVDKGFQREKELAMYTNWMSVVDPRGNLKRPTMLMSKSKMNAVWSWDHCFNAIATSYNDRSLAWDQFMVVFDHQSENGAIPDLVTDYHVVRAFVKPPIHGWALKKLIQNKAVDRSRLNQAYNVLSKWTTFWLTLRDGDGDGLPQYNHGYDSGWDNSTAFDVGFPIVSPDLCTFLVIQMDVLSEVAKMLGKKKEELLWKKKSDALLDTMISKLWKGDKFVVFRSGDNATSAYSQSLIQFMPLLLGKKLPEGIRNKMIRDLKENGYITSYGLASESIKSKLYEPDGYWRGPVWAPSTLLIAEGLVNCGEEQLAKEIATSFCNACKKSGFAENFNAITG